MSSSFLDSLVGLHYRYPDHYVVGREKIREYAVAVKNDDESFHDEKAAADLGHDAHPGAADVHLRVRLPGAARDVPDQQHRDRG